MSVSAKTAKRLTIALEKELEADYNNEIDIPAIRSLIRRGAKVRQGNVERSIDRYNRHVVRVLPYYMRHEINSQATILNISWSWLSQVLVHISAGSFWT